VAILKRPVDSEILIFSIGKNHRSCLLSVPVSEKVFARLVERAAEQGTTPERVAAAELERESPNPATDPLLNCIGMIESDVADAAERHD
jgi:hypothetical protein